MIRRFNDWLLAHAGNVVLFSYAVLAGALASYLTHGDELVITLAAIPGAYVYLVGSWHYFKQEMEPHVLAFRVAVEQARKSS